MANTGAHSAFPSRPYSSTFGRGAGGAGGQAAFQTPYGAGQSGTAVGGGGGFGAGAPGTGVATATQQQREAQRLERERVERMERERREAEERGVLESLSEEQREEVNEAVRIHLSYYILHYAHKITHKGDNLFRHSSARTSVRRSSKGCKLTTHRDMPQFSLFDLDKDSYIDYHELKVALKALGFDLPKSDILSELQTHGVPASTLPSATNPNPNNPAAAGKAPLPAHATFSGPSRLLLSHAAFLQLAASLIAARDPREEISRAFDLFDLDGKGRIEVADLRRVARELGEGLQEEELQAMIDEFDIRGEGGIGRDEFMGICLGS